MAWAQQSGAIRKWGWLVPTLLALINPPMFAQRQGPSSARTRVNRQVVVSVPDRKLAVVEGEGVLRVFPIAVGAASNPSPTGNFEVAKRLERPTYYRLVPPGKDNPLGPRWIGLNAKGYGIHGTNVPGSVGKAVSHGCIRLRNRDIVQLFAMVEVCDTVEIHGERDEVVARLFGGAPESADSSVQLAQQSRSGAVAGAQ